MIRHGSRKLAGCREWRTFWAHSALQGPSAPPSRTLPACEVWNSSSLKGMQRRSYVHYNPWVHNESRRFSSCYRSMKASLSNVLPLSHPHFRPLHTLGDSEQEHVGKSLAKTREDVTVLYKGKGMRVLRILVRLKVLQLVGVGALALPLAHFANGGVIPLGTLLAVLGVSCGAAAASTALWFYSSRYVGELAYIRRRTSEEAAVELIRIATLDFWGNRQNLEVALDDVIPPLHGLPPSALAAVAAQTLLPLDVKGQERQFVLSLRHGRLLNKQKLLQLLGATSTER